jgi:hypothetical protein
MGDITCHNLFSVFTSYIVDGDASNAPDLQVKGVTMFKFAFLLFLAAGLAIGLLIGFNPQLHHQALLDARQSQVVLADLRTSFTETFNSIALRLHSGVHLSVDKPSSGSQQVKFSWKQVDRTLARLWEEVKNFFAGLSVRASL